MEEKVKNIEKKEVIELLEGAIDYLDKVFLKKNLISDPLEEENIDLAFQEIENFISGIETLNQLLYNLQDLLDLDYEEIKYEGSTLNNYIVEFNKFLSNKLLEAIENEDYLLISDIVNHELSIHLKEYQKVFICLLDYVK